VNDSYKEKESILWFDNIAVPLDMDNEEEEYLHPKKSWIPRVRGMNMKEYIRRRAFVQEKIFFTTHSAREEEKTHELYLWLKLQMRS
jgi:hypothetical protein